MEPKDKAIEIFKKYYCLENNSKNKINVIQFDTAKQCALIAVDEILKPSFNGYVKMQSIVRYWEEVKKEIENLQQRYPSNNERTNNNEEY